MRRHEVGVAVAARRFVNASTIWAIWFGIVARGVRGGVGTNGSERRCSNLANTGCTATTAMASPIMINNRWPERPAIRGLLMPTTVSAAATMIDPRPHWTTSSLPTRRARLSSAAIA